MSYPSQSDLDRVKKWNEKDGGHMALVYFLDEIWNKDYGAVEIRDVALDEHQEGESYKEVRFITGGWSGNEDIISALIGTWFYHVCWESSHRGGMMIFHVPRSST